MNRVLVKALLVALLMLGSCGAALYMAPPDRSAGLPAVSLESMIPDAFGDWKLDRSQIPIPMSADVESALYAVYDAVLGRTYVDSTGARVMLSVGYSQQQGGVQKPHWQEICYRSQGFTVEDIAKGRAVVAGRDIPVTRMVATMRSRVEPVTYWLTLGDYVVTGRWDRLVRLLRMGLARESSEGYLFRVSSLSTDIEGAFAKQIEFSNALVNALPPDEARKLVGTK